MSDASEHITAANRAVAMELPFADTRDFDDARRGYISTLNPGVIHATDGRVVWDIDAYSYLDDECPDTVHPSLWRQARLNVIHGLFEVAPGFYQVRGLDLSNMTIIEGDDGVIVIDPLISNECAASALALYREHRGNRPVTGLIYTHSHIDHFGGAKGVLTPEEVAAGVPVIAPSNFVEHAVSENLHAGPAMSRRATYMYGAALPKGATGQVTAGLGPTTSTGTISLLVPTVEIATTGHTLTVDGVEIVFQLTPGTEAPSEMNFFFPRHGLLCAAENATHNLHNTLTLRGALVRDPHVWSNYLNETIEMFGADTQTVFASHHWPTWGNRRAVDFLATQRDLYGYLNDQTLRLLNRGLTGPEIAEHLELPPGLANTWHCRGYYGSVSHNTKAVYQRFLGWFDGNPARLWAHPPEAAAPRYVQSMGGADAVLALAHSSFEAGDYRWAAELLDHLIFSDPDHTDAKELQARTFEQLAYGAENATWRNFYLTGAAELRGGVLSTPTQTGGIDLVAALTQEQLLDMIAIRIDAPRVWTEHLVINWTIDDREFSTTLRNGVFTYVAGRHDHDAPTTVTTPGIGLVQLALGLAGVDALAANGTLTVDGDRAAVVTLCSALEQPPPTFNIVTP